MSLASDLQAAGWPFPLSWFGLALVLTSVVLAIVSAVLASAWSIDPTACFVIVFFVSVFVLFRMPAVLAMRSQRRLEAQVGSLLRLLSVRLAFEPFEAALKAASLQPALPHPALQRLVRDLDRGLPTLSALGRLGGATPSVLIKKAAMQLAFCYRQGDASALSALADEFSQAHAAALHRFSARSSFASVWFETSAALLPLLVSAYVLVGASFLQFTFAAPAPFLLLAVGFPLLNAALVLHVFLASPEVS